MQFAPNSPPRILIQKKGILVRANLNPPPEKIPYGRIAIRPNEFAPTEFKSPSQTIGAIIRGFKGASTKRIKEYYFSNSGSGESIFAPKESIKKSNSKEDNRTGELQFDSESNSKKEKNSQYGRIAIRPDANSPLRIKSGSAIITSISFATKNLIIGSQNIFKTIPLNGRKIHLIANF